MERNGRFCKSNYNQYKNNLSPFGQTVFDVLLNNFNKEEDYNNYRVKNRYDRDRRYCYEQKRKVITFEDSRISRPSIFSQNVPLYDNSYDNSTSVKDTVNKDNDFTSTQLFQLNSIETNANDNSLNVALRLSDPKQNNSKTHRSNSTSAELCRFDSVPNKDLFTSSELLQFDSKQNNYLQNNTNEDNFNVTAVDLIRNKQMLNGTPENHIGVCRIDLLKPLDTNNNFDKFIPESFNETLNISVFERSIPINGNQANDMRKDVSWNEMFDSELLPDTIAPVIKGKLVAIQKTTANEKPIKISFPEDVIKSPVINSKVTHKSDVVKNEAEKTKAIPKPVKRKKDITSLEKKVPKKFKENNIKTIRGKKEKYTKTVKKWLDGVDPNNSVEVEKNAIIIPVDTDTTIKTLDKIVKDTLVIKEQNPPKKIIQAQLKNKGGIMKFSKPEDPKEGNNDNGPAGNVIDTVSKAVNKVNVKKSKPKFIAPIKSQVPLKDIEFLVLEVNETNWKEHVAKLENAKNIELYAVLTYSNGFCQLNKQFTEDNCIPEGIMLLADQDFYYFKKTKDKFSFSDIIIKFLENQTVVCYEGKNILIFFKENFELEIDIVIHDVKIGGSLLEPDNPAESFSDLQKLMSTTPDYRLATECKLQKTAWYLTLLRDCADKLKTKLQEQSLWRLFEDIEMKVLPIIADMEFRGILVDTEKLKSMEGTLLSRMKTVELECYRAAGKSFQMTSPVQVAAILYDELQLHTKGNLVVKETTNKGTKSTSEAMLRTLVPLHPLPGLILEYRRLHKAHATFLTGIGQHVKDGVIKPVWVQTAAATGRIAANNPNVQAIPKAPFCLSSDADNLEEVLNLRSVYVARPGQLLLAADFKQVECRVFAAAAADAVLLEALRSGGDLFTVLAAKWLNKPERAVGAADRERTKRIVYARLYGAGARKLMDILDISHDQALNVQASFDRTFPSLKSFGACVARACADGRAPRTPCGRARALPALLSADAAQRAHAQRQALNFLVQGTAADICKVAMSRAHSQLRAAGVSARLLLQIHDELVWEVAERQLPAAYAIIKCAMESSGRAAGLPELPLAAAAGRSWGELHIDPQTAP